MKRLFALLKLLNINDEGRAELIHNFTDGRTSSAKILTRTELDALCNRLQRQLQPPPETDKRCDKMRKAIIRMAHEMGWELPGTNKIDMISINAWCEKYGYLHKKLNAYTLSELPKLVTQFEEVHKYHLSKVK